MLPTVISYIKDRLSGRKTAVVVMLSVFGLLFGSFVVYKEASLAEAAIYIAAMNAPGIAYLHYNVKQKEKVGNNNGAAS